MALIQHAVLPFIIIISQTFLSTSLQRLPARYVILCLIVTLLPGLREMVTVIILKPSESIGVGTWIMPIDGYWDHV